MAPLYARYTPPRDPRPCCVPQGIDQWRSNQNQYTDTDALDNANGFPQPASTEAPTPRGMTVYKQHCVLEPQVAFENSIDPIRPAKL